MKSERRCRPAVPLIALYFALQVLASWELGFGDVRHGKSYFLPVGLPSFCEIIVPYVGPNMYEVRGVRVSAQLPWAVLHHALTLYVLASVGSFYFNRPLWQRIPRLFVAAYVVMSFAVLVFIALSLIERLFFLPHPGFEWVHTTCCGS